MLTRPLSLVRFLGVVLLTVVLCSVVVVALPHNPYIRFQNLKGTIYERASWIYERIHFDDTPIDVMFLGSSRSGAGVYPTMLEPALADRGVAARVVNFALPSAGFDIRETLAEDVLKTHKVKLLVFEVSEAFPRDGHDAFGEIATTGQLLRAPWLVNRNLPHNLLRLPLRQMLLAFGSLAPDAFGYRAAFDPSLYAGSTVDPRSMLNFAEDLTKLDTPEHAATLDQQSQRRHREITPPILPESLAWVEFGVSRSYVERITALAEEQGVEVAFLFLPFYKGRTAPLEEDWLTTWGPVWKADFMMNDPRNYEDSGHSAASPRMKAALTGWLADHVAAMLQQ